MCYAESDDGVTWTKPELGLVDFNGNKKNNICLVESEVPSLAKVNDFLSVIYEPDDPDPNRRYKCAYIAHPPFDDVRGGRSKIGPDERRWGAFICATSPDGLSWKVVGDRPMNAGGERFEVSGLYRFGDFYYATGQLISPWTWRMDGSDVGRVTLDLSLAGFCKMVSCQGFFSGTGWAAHLDACERATGTHGSRIVESGKCPRGSQRPVAGRGEKAGGRQILEQRRHHRSWVWWSATMAFIFASRSPITKSLRAEVKENGTTLPCYRGMLSQMSATKR